MLRGLDKFKLCQSVVLKHPTQHSSPTCHAAMTRAADPLHVLGIRRGEDGGRGLFDFPAVY